MRLIGRVVRKVRMLVMLIVKMEMIVLHRLVGVPMFMALRKVEPDTSGHKHARSGKHPIKRALSKGKGKGCASKGSG